MEIGIEGFPGGIDFFESGFGKGAPELLVNHVNAGLQRFNGGVGLRIRTPYFLIRLDYGIKVDRQPGEPRARPFFSIGQSF